MNPNEISGSGARSLLEIAEATLAKYPPAAVPGDTDVKRLLHNFQVQQIELKMQNEALREAQRDLETSRDRYANLYEFAPVGYLSLNHTGIIEQINLTAVKLLRMERIKLLHHSFFTLIPIEEQPRWMQLFVNVKKHGDKGSMELNMRRGDGSMCYVQLDCDGKATGTSNDTIRLTITDISERRQADTKLHAVLEAIPFAVFVKDAQSRFMLMNKACKTQWGMDFEALKGSDGSDIFPPEQMERFLAMDKRVFAHGDVLDMEETIWSAPLQQNRIGRTFKSPTYDADGHPLYLTCAIVDITERRQVQQLLEASIKDKDALLKEVHHRVKNNLQVITSLLRLEAGHSKVSHTKTVLATMQGRIRTMAQLHESLYRSGTFASVDLGAYLGQIATQAFKAQLVSHDSVQLRLNMSSVEASMDQAISCGLLVNELISDCLKHGFPKGRHGEITVTLEPADEKNHITNAMWCLTVSDTGVGLSPDFEERRQASLGLQLVDDLCQQLGGALQIASKPDQGTQFSLMFHANAPAALVMPS